MGLGFVKNFGFPKRLNSHYTQRFMTKAQFCHSNISSTDNFLCCKLSPRIESHICFGVWTNLI